MSEKIVRHLRVLTESAEKEAVPSRKFFHVGNPAQVPPYGEVLPLLSWVDDNLSRFVLSSAPSASWGRAHPLPIVITLPNRQVAVKDGIFLVSAEGTDRAEPHPGGTGTIHIVHLGQTGELWRGVAKVYLYRLDGMQTKGVLGHPVK
ncbi:MAG: hypothetical protein NVS3B20_14310 [Polyangiales bacterium]